jgi:AcrR family transcriptional regulator
MVRALDDIEPGPARPEAAVPARRLRAGERRDQLFEVALQLFGERGYRATTMDDIAEAAGVTKPLLYQHFSSKRALYQELVSTVSRELLDAIVQATAEAAGPRQQVERGFAAYFRLVVHREAAFRLLYGRSDAEDEELGDALRRVEEAIVDAIDPLIDAGLEPEHRRSLAYAVVGMAEGVSRHWIATRPAGTLHETDPLAADEEAQQMAARVGDLAWAGLRSVHTV